jgi:hypothetical protein
MASRLRVQPSLAGDGSAIEPDALNEPRMTIEQQGASTAAAHLVLSFWCLYNDPVGRRARLTRGRNRPVSLLEGGAVGTVAAAACQRWAPRPRTWFVALAVVGTVASFWLPLTSDATTATMVVLSISHLVAALIIVPALALTLSPR